MPDSEVPVSDGPVSDVLIVGAGIAGLTAARDLAMGGLRVTLLESSDRVGGKVTGHTVAGVELDSGAESFATRGEVVASLVRELGLADELQHPNPDGAWLYQRDGAAHPLPATGLLGIPGSPMSADVLAIVGLRGAFRAQLDALIPGPVGGREKYLGPFVRKRMGQRVLERLVAPVVSGVHSRHPDELEVDRVAPGLRRAVRQNESLAKAVLALRAAAPAGAAVGGLRGGIHRLATELHRDVVAFGGEVRLGCTVASVDATGVTTSTGERITARHRVLTSAATTGGTPVVLATLMLDLAALDPAPRGTGLLVERGADVAAKALTHATAKWSWLGESVPEHHHVVRLSYDADRLPAGDLAEQARTDAETLLGVAIPAAAVTGFARADWTAAPATTPVAPGVIAIGEAASGTGLAAVIGHARAEASRLLSELAGTETRPEDD
jgi:oxygen-dependent protoporphyrinogen oxidase